VSEPGSVRVDALATVQTFPAVHHLCARVQARLRAGVGFAELVGAAFPGGSISGAPKRRALELLREIEPAPRGYFTGSLFWLADDGSLESSILIRTIVVAGGRASIGAGGGIVADSDPELEWRESNAKARASCAALGFEPEDAEAR
jgi:anthranilate/para-aminobenzoate synthase component I